MFDKVLIANRGEIALRIIRGCRDLGVSTVAVHSEVDRTAAFVLLADEAVEIGPAPAAQSYLVIDRIIDAARVDGRAGDPSRVRVPQREPAVRSRMRGARHRVHRSAPGCDGGDGREGARARADAQLGRPGRAGDGCARGIEDTVAAAAQIGYPVLIKASAGGGGIGMRVARDEEELRASFDTAKSTAQRAFGNDTIFLERYLEQPRHIEIQVLADTHGNVIHLGERECSVQRRHQKIVEEAPSPVIDAATRARMGDAAVTAAKAVGYVNAGTVEFIYRNGEFYFLEMNTRLQVEHPITELVYGIDLVAEQLRIASGERLSLTQDEVVPRGHAVECRINAENYARGFLPSPGRSPGTTNRPARACASTARW